MTQNEITSIMLAYLLGSIPFGYLIVKLRSGADIRENGSGGTGAATLSRQAGEGRGRRGAPPRRAQGGEGCRRRDARARRVERRGGRVGRAVVDRRSGNFLGRRRRGGSGRRR